MADEQLLAHAGCCVDASSGALVAPIHVSTTFERGPGLSYPRGHIYSRMTNPTRQLLEVTMAVAEGGVAGAAFASGMAACTAVLLAFPQGVVVLPSDLYHGVVTLLDGVLAAWGMRTVRYDVEAGEKAIAAALDDALALASGSADRVLLWLETPSNPLLRVVDLQAACALARERSICSLVDATWLTPVLCRPLHLGADLVLHSATKYLAGHSDVLAGVVVAAAADSARQDAWSKKAHTALRGGVAAGGDAMEAQHKASSSSSSSSSTTTTTTTGGGERSASPSLWHVAKEGDERAVAVWQRVRQAQTAAGGVASPFDCFLALRGLRTLSLRVRQQCRSALTLARALDEQEAVEAVHYPGLPADPGHVTAAALFNKTDATTGPASSSGRGGGGAGKEDDGERHFGAMLSVRIRGGEAAALRVASRLRCFTRATSLGGTESLVEHRASIEPPTSTTPRNLLRVSVGCEPAHVLVADFLAALAQEASAIQA